MPEPNPGVEGVSPSFPQLYAYSTIHLVLGDGNKCVSREGIPSHAVRLISIYIPLLFPLHTMLTFRLQIWNRLERTPYSHPSGCWQEQKDSNPRHTVLETAVLPTELYSYINGRGSRICTYEGRANGFTVRPLCLLGNPSKMVVCTGFEPVSATVKGW